MQTKIVCCDNSLDKAVLHFAKHFDIPAEIKHCFYKVAIIRTPDYLYGVQWETNIP